MARGENSLGKGGSSPALCICGCGEALQSSRSYRRNGVTRFSRLRPGHVVRLPEWNNRWYNEAQRRGQLRAILDYNEGSCVPSEPVLRLLRARFDTPTAAAKFLGVHGSTTRRLFTQTRMRRHNAERILRILAELPRLPTRRERQRTHRAREAAERRRSRARLKEVG